MKKNLSTPVLAGFLLIICLAILKFRDVVANDHSQERLVKKHLESTRIALRKAQLGERLAIEQARESETELAVLLPKTLEGRPKDATTYRERAIASVIGTSQSDFHIERASSLIETAKADFRNRKYEESNATLLSLIEKYPDSIHAPEAHFLLSEGLFQLKDFEKCIETVERMIRLYPESELTGFALLRLAKIYESRERLEDAAEVYRSLLSHFSQAELREQAERGLRSVDL